MKMAIQANTPNKILIVEPDSDLAAILAEVVQAGGFTPMLARNQDEAFEALDRHLFALALYDVNPRDLLLVEARGLLERAFPIPVGLLLSRSNPRAVDAGFACSSPSTGRGCWRGSPRRSPRPSPQSSCRYATLSSSTFRVWRSIGGTTSRRCALRTSPMCSLGVGPSRKRWRVATRSSASAPIPSKASTGLGSPRWPCSRSQKEWSRGSKGGGAALPGRRWSRPAPWRSDFETTESRRSESTSTSSCWPGLPSRRRPPKGSRTELQTTLEQARSCSETR